MFGRARCLIYYKLMPTIPVILRSARTLRLFETSFSKMKPTFRILALSAVLFAFAVAALPIQAKSDSEQVAVSVGRLLEEGHNTHQPLNDDVSRKFLRTYLELLDFSTSFSPNKTSTS